MSNKTYQIKEGDQLLRIAVEQGVSYLKLLELNPSYQANPNLIHLGETLILDVEEPENTQEEASEPTPEPEGLILPKEGKVQGNSVCQGSTPDIHDVLIFTGEKPEDYYGLNKEQQEQVKREADVLQELASAYQALMDQAPAQDIDDQAKVEAFKDKKQAWIDKAEQAGLFATTKAVASNQDGAAEVLNVKEIESRILALKQRRYGLEQFITWEFSNPQGPTMQLYNKVDARLVQRIEELNALLEEANKPKQSTDAEHSHSHEESNQGAANKSNGVGIREGILLSEKGQRLIYIRESFFSTHGGCWFKSQNPSAVEESTKNVIKRVADTWLGSESPEDTNALMSTEKNGSSNAHTQTEINHTYKKDIVDCIIQDIQKSIINEDEKTAFTARSKEWIPASTGNVFDFKCTEWAFKTDLGTDQNNTPKIAVGGEAQLMRFCLSAQVDKTFKPSEGKMSIGASAKAVMSLAEGKVETSVFLPYEKGYSLYIPYTDANKKDASYPLGAFRGKFTVIMSCFVGARAEGGGSVGVSKDTAQVKKDMGGFREDLNKSGASILWSRDVEMDITKKDASNQPDTPTVAGSAGGGDMPVGTVGIKGTAFAGAEVGGEVSGSLEWQNPTKKQANEFSLLASVKYECKAMMALAGGAEFSIVLVGDKFTFYCSATLACGPGAKGGFGTDIEKKQLWELALLIWEALKVVDYRTLQCINEAAFNYFARAIYYFYTLPSQINESLMSIVSEGADTIDEWWTGYLDSVNDEKKRAEEGRKLAKNIIAGGQMCNETDANLFPPEVLGVMMDCLVQTLPIINHVEQEVAIILLLKDSVQTWRKFEEMLAHMNHTGKKQAGDGVLFDNLSRIYGILHGKQLTDFYKWVMRLAHLKEGEALKVAPFAACTVEEFQRKMANMK